MRSTVTVLAIAFITCASGARAQENQPLVPGSRLRATVAFADSTTHQADLRVIHGDLVSWENERLRLRENTRGDTLEVALVRVKRLEVSRGLRGHSAEGVAIGLVAGVAIGVPLGLAAFKGQEDNLLSFGSSGQWALAYGAGFGVLGALVGALVGSAHKSEEWQLVPAEQIRVRLGVRSQAGGALLAVGLDF